MYKKWLLMAASLPDYLNRMDQLLCPNCQKAAIDYLYIGDLNSRGGWGLVWCSECLQGIHLCRLQVSPLIPAEKFLSFDSPSEELNSLVPDFTRIQP